MEWMSSPSISVMKCGKLLILAFAPAPVVLGGPVLRDGLQRAELRPLRLVLDGLLVGEAGRPDARTQVLEIRSVSWEVAGERRHSGSPNRPADTGQRRLRGRAD
jgi:hypothetical protein